jgi:hypothetical protein
MEGQAQCFGYRAHGAFRSADFLFQSQRAGAITAGKREKYTWVFSLTPV